jgi:hypothetical protein
MLNTVHNKHCIKKISDRDTTYTHAYDCDRTSFQVHLLHLSLNKYWWLEGTIAS